MNDIDVKKLEALFEKQAQIREEKERKYYEQNCYYLPGFKENHMINKKINQLCVQSGIIDTGLRNSNFFTSPEFVYQSYEHILTKLFKEKVFEKVDQQLISLGDADQIPFSILSSNIINDGLFDKLLDIFGYDIDICNYKRTIDSTGIIPIDNIGFTSNDFQFRDYTINLTTIYTKFIYPNKNMQGKKLAFSYMPYYRMVSEKKLKTMQYIFIVKDVESYANSFSYKAVMKDTVMAHEIMHSFLSMYRLAEPALFKHVRPYTINTYDYQIMEEYFCNIAQQVVFKRPKLEYLKNIITNLDNFYKDVNDTFKDAYHELYKMSLEVYLLYICIKKECTPINYNEIIDTMDEYYDKTVSKSGKFY